MESCTLEMGVCIYKKNQQSIYNGRRENKENESTCPFIYEHKWYNIILTRKLFLGNFSKSS